MIFVETPNKIKTIIDKNIIDCSHSKNYSLADRCDELLSNITSTMKSLIKNHNNLKADVSFKKFNIAKELFVKRVDIECI